MYTGCKQSTGCKQWGCNNGARAGINRTEEEKPWEPVRPHVDLRRATIAVSPPKNLLCRNPLFKLAAMHSTKHPTGTVGSTRSCQSIHSPCAVPSCTNAVTRPAAKCHRNATQQATCKASTCRTDRLFFNKQTAPSNPAQHSCSRPGTKNALMAAAWGPVPGQDKTNWTRQLAVINICTRHYRCMTDAAA